MEGCLRECLGKCLEERRRGDDGHVVEAMEIVLLDRMFG